MGPIIPTVSMVLRMARHYSQLGEPPDGAVGINNELSVNQAGPWHIFHSVLQDLYVSESASSNNFLYWSKPSLAATSLSFL